MRPPASVVAVQVPRGMLWNCAVVARALVHMMEVVESPGAPMSDETTAMWRLGGRSAGLEHVMNVGS